MQKLVGQVAWGRYLLGIISEGYSTLPPKKVPLVFCGASSGSQTGPVKLPSIVLGLGEPPLKSMPDPPPPTDQLALPPETEPATDPLPASDVKFPESLFPFWASVALQAPLSPLHSLGEVTVYRPSHFPERLRDIGCPALSGSGRVLFSAGNDGSGGGALGGKGFLIPSSFFADFGREIENFFIQSVNL